MMALMNAVCSISAEVLATSHWGVDSLDMAWHSVSEAKAYEAPCSSMQFASHSGVHL